MSDDSRSMPLRALAKGDDGNPVYIVGLTEEHLQHVRSGKTVTIEMTAFGHRGLILIYGGADRDDLLRQLNIGPGAAFLDGLKPPRKT
jgi:hypothetical protein